MSNRRRLILMRHAKAEPFAATDFDRELTDRGERDASAAGKYLAEAGWLPDVALVSPAARTVGTWEAVRRGAGLDLDATADRALYQGGPEAVLEAVGAVGEDARTLIFVGHNPTVSDLAHTLEDGHGDAEVLGRMLTGYPPAALAVLELEGSWTDLRPEGARLVDFHVAKG